MTELSVEYLLTESVLRLDLSEYPVTNKITGRRTNTYEGTAALQQVAAVPGALKDSCGQGSSIATRIIPGSATAARLAQALAVAKNRKDLGPPDDTTG